MSEKAAVIKSHGHVTPNADGSRTRCGGPTICKVCKAELDALKAQPSGVVLSDASLTLAVDAAMLEMQNISPPLRRSDCERLIRAALSSPTYRAYTTTPGEAVAGIALRQLGDESRWVEIRDLNAHAFPDIGPHDYYPVGTELRLPALSAPSHGEQVRDDREVFDKWFRDAKGIGEAVDTTFIDSAFFPYKAFKFGIEYASEKVNGWRLVPMEPTPEMLQAGADEPLAGDSDDDAPEDYRAVYKAMLAAAPSSGSRKEQGE